MTTSPISVTCVRKDFLDTKYLTIYQPVTEQLVVSQPDRELKINTVYGKLVFNFEKPPLKRLLYLIVWCTSHSRVRQEMSNSELKYILVVNKAGHVIYLHQSLGNTY